MRDLGYIDRYIGAGCHLTGREEALVGTIRKLYEQQKYMFDNRTHRVADRIVSLSQPYIRPIVRGKAKSPVEFGAKYDVSIDEKGHARLEKLAFDPYNESTVLQDAMERVTASAPAITRSASLSIRSTGRGRTAPTARSRKNHTILVQRKQKKSWRDWRRSP